MLIFVLKSFVQQFFIIFQIKQHNKARLSCDSNNFKQRGKGKYCWTAIEEGG